MSQTYELNPFYGRFDLTDDGLIPEVTVDPSSPTPGQVWVKRTDPIPGGKLKAISGLGFPIVSPAGGTTTYQLSYYTLSGDTKRVLLAGPGEMPFKKVGGDYTLANDDYTVDCTEAVTITIPTASGVRGKVYNIKNTSSGNVTVNTVLSQLIDDTTSITLEPYENLTIQSDSNSWLIL